jgi:hypothetical protein
LDCASPLALYFPMLNRKSFSSRLVELKLQRRLGEGALKDGCSVGL